MKKKFSIIAIPLAALLCFTITACSPNSSPNANNVAFNDEEPVASTAVEYDSSSYIEWSNDKYPDYIAHLGESDIVIDEMPDPGEIIYEPTDELGRAHNVYASLTPINRVDNVRNNLPNPAGWPKTNPKVTVEFANGKTYNGYALNRSHSLADSLGGEEITANLITGFRTENVGDNTGSGGTAYCEYIARDYLDSHPDGILYYRVMPVYIDDEIIPRGKIIDMLSADGEINEKTYIFNNMNGYELNYNTGEVTEIESEM